MKKIVIFLSGLFSFPLAVFVCGMLSILVFLLFRSIYVLAASFLIFIALFFVSLIKSARTKHEQNFQWWLSGLIIGGALILMLFFAIFKLTRSIHLPEYPDKKEIIEKIETYKMEHNKYPESLNLVGYGKYQVQGVSVDIGVNYWLRDDSFTLCYVYAELIGTNGSCYESKKGIWEAR